MLLMTKIFLFTSLLVFCSARLIAQTELDLQTFTGTIYGSLQFPQEYKAVPIVLIISGSGPTDRNGNNPQMQNNSLKMLADSLQSHGIATLRYDKRGIAASKDAGAEESDLRFDSYVDDACAWIRKLKKDTRFSKVIVAGHSEGSLIGMMASNREHADGFISIAGPGRSADLVLKEQLSTQPDPIKLTCFSTIDSLIAGKTVSEINPMLYSLFRPSVQPYLISWFKYDPQKEISKLAIPVLILQGSTDLQVTTNDADLLAKSAIGSKLFIIDGMNHILKNASNLRQENIATYSEPSLPLNEMLVNEMLTFLNQFR
jgi:uncharacterized protein